MFVTISFLGSAFTRLATEVVDGTWWSAGVAVGAATGCVAEVGGWVPCGSSRLRRYRVFWRRSPARLCKTARLRRLVTKPPGHPDGFALEIRTTGVLSGWESSRICSRAATKSQSFQRRQVDKHRMWLTSLLPFENSEAKPERQMICSSRSRNWFSGMF